MTTENTNDETSTPKAGSWLISLLLCGLLGLAVWFAVDWINSTEPEAERGQAAKKSAMLIQTVTVEQGDFRPRIVALGEVQASRQVNLGARVEGDIVKRADIFTEGYVVKQGELLIGIDAADYQTRLAQRQSELAQALSAVAIEEGKKNVALMDLELLKGSVKVKDKALVLREPQLRSVQAAVKMAEAAVSQAKIDLSRTEIVAPFDALVMERSVDLGARVSEGSSLGRLVGIDEYWVVATVPMGSLRWLSFSDDEPNTSLQAEIHDAKLWGAKVVRKVRVERFLGELDPETRLARVVLAVDDPLGIRDKKKPKLILGSLLECVIYGREIKNVVRLPRELVRKGNTAWVNKDDQLEVRKLEILFSDKEFAYVASGLKGGDQVVTTNLSSVREGAALRMTDEEAIENE